MKNNLVVKKNPLVNARFKLTPLEIKIVFSVISMVDKNDSDFWTYQIKVTDITSEYDKMRKACRSLMTKVFEVQEDNGWLMMSWFSHIRYKKREGMIECAFDPNLKPYLLHIKDNFTSYTLSSVLSMSSTYSIRLYELLKQYEPIGTRTFNIDDLQDMLQIPKSYTVWRDFKRRVLDSSIKEINECSDIKVVYDLITKGRKITAISFSIAPKIKKLTFRQYIHHIRSNFANTTLLRFKDTKTDEIVELSVSTKGLLYNQLDPNWKINGKRADQIWNELFEREIML